MKTKNKIAAFSYVEALMVLVVTAIIMAVSAPMITKKAKTPPQMGGGGGAPIGSVVIWSGAGNPPAGWVECDGREITAPGYEKLRKILGGAERLPDMNDIYLTKISSEPDKNDSEMFEELHRMAENSPEAQAMINAMKNKGAKIPRQVKVRWIIKVE